MITFKSCFRRLSALFLAAAILMSGAAACADSQETEKVLTYEEFAELVKDEPDEIPDCSFKFYGINISTAETETLEFKKLVKFTDDSLDELRGIIPYLKNLKTITVFRCKTSDEAMDKLRDDFPEINIRWVVSFGAFSAWSDCEKIWAMAGLFHDEYAENLKYFHNLKYLDVGHNGLTRCDFLNYMPDLEVLILAIGSLNDITPMANLKHLEYLEICDTQVTDLSPLAGCTTLEHINLGGIPATDLTPLYSLTNLKRLFADNMFKLTEEERLEYKTEFTELLPDAEVSFLRADEIPGGTENGYWRFSRGPYTGSYVPRYKLLREQFGYDHDYNQAYVYDY